MVTELEYAELSNRVYGRTAANRSPVPAGWEELTWLPDSASTGFSAGVYRKGDEIVISFTGTNESKTVDFLEANIPLGLGATSPQLVEAIRLSLETKALYPNATISFTGHSLGAGLASMMAVFFNKDATIFDAAPFELGARSPVGITAAVTAMLSMGYADSDLLSYAASLGASFTQREGRVSAVSLEGEVLAGLRAIAPTIYGGAERVVPIGAQSILGSGGAAFGARVELHSMTLLVAMLRSSAFAEAVRQNSDALELFFDSRLYKRNPETSNQANFMDRLLLADMGNPASGTPGRPILDMFAADLARIEGGSGMSGQPSLRKALTVAAMEYYYFKDMQLASQLFAQLDGGIQFKYQDIGVEQFGLKSPRLLAEAMKGYLQDDEWNLVGGRLESQDAWQVQSGEGGMVWTASGATTFDAVVGGAGVDVIDSGAGDDILIGGAGQDFLNGGADNDTLIGGVGVDVLEGGSGNDFLLGGLDIDTYVFNGNFGSDIIQDSDGKGLIKIDDVTVNGAGALKVNDSTWQTADKSLRYVLAQVSADRSDLIITNSTAGNQITIQNWNSGARSFGIQLSDAPFEIQTDGTETGDFKKNIVNGASAGEPPIWLYTLADFTPYANYASDGSAPGEADILQGHQQLAPQSYYGLGGNDGIAARGGDDYIDGGQGDDLLLGSFGADTILGGEGNDYIFGSAFGQFTLPLQVDFTPPESSGTELVRGFSWVIFDPPGEDANGRNTVEFRGVAIQGWNVETGGTLSFETTGNTIDGGAGNDYIAAGSAADFVTGGDGNDTIEGMGRGDVLFGGAGDDYIAGDGVQGYYLSYTPLEFHGNDILVGGAGNDFLLGQGGNDELYGGVGKDSLFGDDFNLVDTPDSIHGSDYLDGGDGDDEASGGGNNDTIFGGAGNDKLWGDGPDSVVGAAFQGSDYLDGEDGNDELTGGGGDDVLIGGAGADTMLGDDVQSKVAVSVHGDDYMEGGDGNDLMVGGGGSDEMYGGAGDDQLEGDDRASNVDPTAHGQDLLDGGDGNDLLYGGGDDDVLFGGAGADTLYGDDDLAELPGAFHGADRLEGEAGDDNLYGGGGDDTLIGGTGTDYLDGGAGNDTFFFDAGDSPLSGNGSTEVVVDDGGANTVVFGGGIAAGSIGLSTDASGRYLVIQYGTDDRIAVRDGLGGSIATYSFADVGDLSWSDLIGRYSDTALVGTNGIGTSQVVGGRNADNLAATGGFALLSGGRGNDTLFATGGGNTYRYGVGDGTDSITDIGGTNPNTGAPLPASTIVFGSGIRSSDVRLGYDGALVLQVGPDSNDKVRIVVFNAADALAAQSIDRFVFADGTALTHAELLSRGFDITGTAGDDTLAGTSVSDRMDGGAGNDLLQGGAGSDTYAWGVGAGQDTINDGDASSGGVDTLRIGTGLTPQGVVLNRIGNDLLVRVRNGNDAVSVVGHFSGSGLEQIVFDDGTVWNAAEIASHVTNELTAGADNFTGSSADEIIDGLAGNDTIRGGGGNDTIDGNVGNDALFGDDGNDQLTGGPGNDTLVGGPGADVYLFGPGDGTDTIDDQSTDGSIDILRLAPGITSSDVRLSVSGAAVALTLTATGDRVTFGGPDEAASKKIERIEFSDGTVWTEAQWGQRALQGGASSGNDTINGFAATADVINGLDGNDSLSGNAGDDSLYGDNGNDTLAGSTGNDLLDGGAGFDSLDGGAGDDTLIDGEVMNGGAGNDTYRLSGWPSGGNNIVISEVPDVAGNVDVLYLPPGVSPGSVDVRPRGSGPYDDLALKDKVTGNQITLPMYFNSQGNDYKIEQIRFADGTVWSVADVFAMTAQSQMTAGNDTIAGFRWNDVLDGQAGNDFIIGSTGDDQLLGGTGDDTIYGDSVNDSFALASDGNDSLDGGAGNDTLSGGGGNDTYFFGRGRGSDTVIEVGGTDRIVLDAGVLTTDVNLFRVGSVLILAIDQGPTQLAVNGQFSGTASQAVESIQFADGTVWNSAQIQALAVAGTPNAMTGTAGNDTFVVDDPGDTITEGANQGVDTVQSSIGYTLGSNLENLTLTGYLNVFAIGNELNNVITGNAGSNVLKGSNFTPGGRDTLIGGAGDDVYYVDGATGAFIGDANSDDSVIEAAGQGNDTVITSTVNYTLPSEVENLKSTFTAVAVSLVGNVLDNVLEANAGNSGGATLDGGAGADTMRGTQGNDLYFVDNPGDVIEERGFTTLGQNLSRDTVSSSISYTLGAWLEDLRLTGSSAISGTGNALNNLLDGSTNSASNVLAGGAGDDTYRLGAGDSAVEAAGQGTDAVVLVQGPAGTYTLASYANIENLSLEDGTGAADLVGDAGANQLIGNGLNNSLSGGSGNDVIFDSTSVRNDQDSMYGGAGNDQLTSNSGADLLDGGSGDDVLNGSGDVTVVFGRGYGADAWTAFGANANRRVLLNADLQLSDLVVSRNGADLQLSFGQGDGLTSVNFFVDATSTAHNGLFGALEFADGTRLDPQTLINRMIGGNSNVATAAADVLFGTGAADVVNALAGDDRLFSGNGNDDLTGGLGNDLLQGGGGDDTYRFARGDGQDTIVELAGTADSVSLAAGIATTDVVVVRNGADLQIQISGTSDQVSVQGFFNAAANEIESLRFADGTIWDNATLKDLASKITGTSGADMLVGSAAADRIYGLAGNDGLSGLDGDDLLDGGAGNDTMDGGPGNDTYIVDSASDVVSEAAGQGTDSVQSSVTLTLASNVENLVLTGTSAINGTGNTLANTITGNGAANTLSGGTGADTLIGRAGDDTYVVDNTGDVVTELPGEGTDLVQSSVTYTLAANVENLTLTGSSAINATGNALDNVLTGNSGANTLTGGAGNDTYVVGTGDTVTENAHEGTDTVQSSVTWTLGNNIENLTLTGSSAINGTGNGLDNVLTGNSAANTLTGGAGNDTYVVGTGDTVVEAASGGTDTVMASITWTTLAANVENLSLTGTSAINGTGNTLNNVLAGNTAANTLNGGAGNDTLIGGAGNDTYVVDNTGDVVTELAGEGIDLVQSGVTYTLAANVENLTLTGSSAINATGNALDNVLTGNSGNNTLTGGAGNDTYVVGTGDTVAENANEGIDTVQSSITWTLGNNIENLTLTGSSAINATGNALDNVLTGNSGTNTLTGGAGNDTYVVGTGDTTTEAASAGTDTVMASITWTLATNLENLTLTGSSAINGTGNTADNVLIGNAGANTLSGLAGNDTYDGGAGNDALTDNSTTSNDIYRWGTGYGVDTITDSGGTDRVEFGTGITAAQLAFAHVGNNLEVTISGNSTDKLVVSNYYVGTANRIEDFRLSDGSSVPGGQLPASIISRETFAAGDDRELASTRETIGPVTRLSAQSPTLGLASRWPYLGKQWLSPVMRDTVDVIAPAVMGRWGASPGSTLLEQQAHVLLSAMAGFDANRDAAADNERQTIQPVQRPGLMWVSPAVS